MAGPDASAHFSPVAAAGEKRKAEEKLPVAPLAGVPTHLDKLQLGAHRDPEQMRAQYKVGTLVPPPPVTPGRAVGALPTLLAAVRKWAAKTGVGLRLCVGLLACCCRLLARLRSLRPVLAAPLPAGVQAADGA